MAFLPHEALQQATISCSAGGRQMHIVARVDSQEIPNTPFFAGPRRLDLLPEFDMANQMYYNENIVK
jgi:hypothetical protein